MADVILVVLQGAEMADPLLGAAVQLAELAGGGRVIALAVRAPMEAINMFPEGVLTEEAADLLQIGGSGAHPEDRACLPRVGGAGEARPCRCSSWMPTGRPSS